MKLWSNSIRDGAPIPGEFAFAVPASAGHVALSANRNPHLAWSGAPAGTRSYALICHDPDVPSRGDDVNQEGRSVPITLPRVDFFHWVLIDIPVGIDEIAAGSFSDGVVARGKPSAGPLDTRQGLNDYTGWFAGDADMGGDYHGYDGPCPPWNDELPHRYIFTLYALDIDRVPVDGRFGGADVRAAIAQHILAQASFTGRYTLNPAVRL
ncbi:YbhB/YbcL family Raf kinase inhibitor-like protein [Niveibacterium sp.]|uniref:YbhB/YbcL family Raf kinase inhibitor-like protein n=1 Tax=Niveibacterium sp. TaxID=2017444 RepID=UPI0035B23639